jgi:all-trans-8'-apo-beta-carotenal 15,15'-oxygenase
VNAPADHAPLIERLFEIEFREQAGGAELRGTLPDYVRGVCCWNGPAIFVRGELRYRHWLDGDGMVCALTLGEAGAHVRTRFVRDKKFQEETAAGRALFRTFGTAFPGDRLRRGVGLESPTNVSVYPYRGDLLAFAEQGLPWALDPRTLETRELYTFGGQLNEVTPFSAHPKIDTHTGELFNFGVSFAAGRPALHLFRFDADATLVYRRRVPLPYAAAIHDFALSDRFAVFYVGPLVLDLAALLDNGVPLIDALRWEPERGSLLMLIDRGSGELAGSIPLDGTGYCLHLVNAFDDGGRLVVDVVEYERPIYDQYQVVPSLFTDVPRAIPLRLTLDPNARKVLDRQTLQYDCAPDFPAHDLDLTGRRYEDFWMLGIGATGQPGRKFFNQIARLSWDTGEVDVWQAPHAHYLGGEPVFVRDPNRARHGVVICQHFDATRSVSEFLVFDAARPSVGPLATIAAPEPVPLLFHSSFVPGDADL